MDTPNGDDNDETANGHGTPEEDGDDTEPTIEGSDNTASDPTVNDAQNSEGGSSGSSASAVGGAIGAVLAIILLLTVTLVAVLLCIKRKKSPRKVLVRRVGEADGFTNEVYGGNC